MLTEQQLLNALRQVIHPEKGKSIVDLGWIAAAFENEDGIFITIKPDRSSDPFLKSLKSTIVKSLRETFGSNITIASIEIDTEITASSQQPQPKLVPNINKIIAIASGKGGVGKSTVAANLAIALAKEGYKVGLLDADIFGPSIPKMFGAEDFKPEMIKQDGVDKIVPLEKYGVKILSAGFFVDPSSAIIWRGPLASNFLKQLIEMGDWGNLDYMLIDLPPGTSDIHLTIVQSLSLTGAIIVTTPQEVALSDAIKAISMFQTDNIEVPILGLIENMAWFTPAELPENRYYIFGKEGCKRLAQQMNIPLLGQIPIVQSICENGDKGTPSAMEYGSPMEQSFAAIVSVL